MTARPTHPSPRLPAHAERAIRSLEKWRFRKEGRERESVCFGDADHDVIRMALLKSEWSARKPV